MLEKKPYPRYFNTPNQEFLSKKIASLENGEKALIFTSGMAAISTSIMANVRSGAHVIFQEDLYGGTRNFIKTEFDKYGIEYSFTRGLESEDFINEIKDNNLNLSQHNDNDRTEENLEQELRNNKTTNRIDEF